MGKALFLGIFLKKKKVFHIKYKSYPQVSPKMWITECKLCRCPLCIRLSMGLTGTVLPQSSVQLKKSRNYLTLWGFAYIIETMFSKQIKQILYLIRRCRNNENDISAKEKIQS